MPEVPIGANDFPVKSTSEARNTVVPEYVVPPFTAFEKLMSSWAVLIVSSAQKAGFRQENRNNATIDKKIQSE